MQIIPIEMRADVCASAHADAGSHRSAARWRDFCCGHRNATMISPSSLVIGAPGLVGMQVTESSRLALNHWSADRQSLNKTFKNLDGAVESNCGSLKPARSQPAIGLK
jgi:hypothetical protein